MTPEEFSALTAADPETVDYSKFPEPPVPADLDLCSFKYMPFHVDQFLGGDIHFEMEDMRDMEGVPPIGMGPVRLWAKVWHEVPAGSMLNNVRNIAGYAGIQRKGNWHLAVRAAMHGFSLHNDGRWYHNVVCKVAMESSVNLDKNNSRTAKATEARMRKLAEDKARKALVEENLGKPDPDPDPGSGKIEEDISQRTENAPENIPEELSSVEEKPDAAPISNVTSTSRQRNEHQYNLTKENKNISPPISPPSGVEEKGFLFPEGVSVPAGKKPGRPKGSGQKTFNPKFDGSFSELKAAYPERGTPTRNHGGNNWDAGRKNFEALLGKGEKFDELISAAGAYRQDQQRNIGTVYVMDVKNWLRTGEWKKYVNFKSNVHQFPSRDGGLVDHMTPSESVQEILRRHEKMGVYL